MVPVFPLMVTKVHCALNKEFTAWELTGVMVKKHGPGDVHPVPGAKKMSDAVRVCAEICTAHNKTSVTPNHIAQRKVDDRVALMSETYKDIPRGSLLNNTLSGRVFEVCWPMANPDSFKPLESLPERLAQI